MEVEVLEPIGAEQAIKEGYSVIPYNHVLLDDNHYNLTKTFPFTKVNEDGQRVKYTVRSKSAEGIRYLRDEISAEADTVGRGVIQ